MLKSSLNSCRYVQLSGAKQKIMELMNHEDDQVKYKALQSVQIYMKNAWE